MPVTPDVDALFQSAMSARKQTGFGKIGLAVSGGGDSIAMMHLAARHCRSDSVHVFSVDHGLRPEAQDEIAIVKKQAHALGLAHDVGRWRWDQSGNMQAAARAGRWDALGQLARSHDVTQIWMGHTQDDQIETVLMRMARGSGVDGLTAMRPCSARDGLTLFRPLLDIGRDDLRKWLTKHAIAWQDDPSNDDTRFDRIQARQLFGQMEKLGLTRKRVLRMVDHMQAAQMSLQYAAAAFAKEHIHQDQGDLLLSPATLAVQGGDLPRRVMAAAIGWINGATYRPRFDQLRHAMTQAQAGASITLAGCVLRREKSGLVRLSREVAAAQLTTVTSAVREYMWDNRWRVAGPFTAGLRVGPLGDGIEHCADWRAAGMPRGSVMATPAIWQNTTLIAAPVAGFGAEWTAQIVADFHSSVFAIEE